MSKGHHFLFDNEKPLEKLWNIAIENNCTEEIRQWMNDYIAQAGYDTSVDKISYEHYKERGDLDEFMNALKQNALRALGNKCAQVGHTFHELHQCDETGRDVYPYEKRYRFGMIVVKPNKSIGDNEPPSEVGDEN